MLSSASPSLQLILVKTLKKLLKGPPEPEWLYNCHFRGHDLSLSVLGDLAVEGHRLLGSDISRRSSYAEGEGSRLGDEPHLWIVECESGWMHGEGDPACLSRCEGDAGKPEQHALRTGDRGDLVTVVELHYLVTCLLSHVLHVDGDLDRFSRTLRLHSEVTVGKRGVAQPMPEGEQRCRRRVDIVAEEHGAAPARTNSNVVGDLANRAWQAHGQPPARIHLAG